MFEFLPLPSLKDLNPCLRSFAHQSVAWAEIPIPCFKGEKHMSLVDELEQRRQNERESEEQEEEGRGRFDLSGP